MTKLHAIRIQVPYTDLNVQRMAIIAKSIDSFKDSFWSETVNKSAYPTNHVEWSDQIEAVVASPEAAWLKDHQDLFDAKNVKALNFLSTEWLTPDVLIKSNGIYAYLPLIDAPDSAQAKRFLTHMATTLFGPELRTFVISEYSENHLPKQTPLNLVA